MEATVVCIDNSECTRNGDFEPSRFQAQADAVNLLAGVKTSANRENTVGVLSSATMAGKTPKVMVTPTPDLAKILGAISGINLEGSMDLSRSAQIAQLALKHRQNKNQRQRVVVFVGSPVSEEQAVLEKVGKKLKKNNVSVDVVAFGDCAEANREKLEAFVAAVNKDSNSNYVEAPMGSNLCDFLLSSPIVSQAYGGGGDTGAGAAPAAGGEGGAPPGFEFGVDPNIDPELALALRVSMEEERARQAAQAQAAASAAAAADPSATAAAEAAVAAVAGTGTTAAAEATPAAEPASVAAAADGGDENGAAAMEEDEDALIQQALALSMQEHAPQAAADVVRANTTADVAMDEDDDPELAAALAMSMAEAQPGTSTEAIQNSVAGLPGVDLNNPDVQNAINEAAKESKQDGSKE